MQTDNDLILDHLNDPIFHLIGEVADEMNRPCFVIGGYVRDIFLDRPSKDIDIVTLGSGIELAEAVTTKLGKRAHLSTFRNFGTAQVKYSDQKENIEIEFVGARKESYSHDSRKPIVEELGKIIRSDIPSRGFILLDDCKLLPIIFPEVAALKGTETIEGRGHKDNFYHSLAVLDNVALRSRNEWLRWAALLHDIGKPRTKRYDSRLGWTFHNHNFIGEKMIPGIFRKMKLPLNEKMKYVQKLVGLHMRPIVLAEEVVTDSAVRRLLFDAGDDIDDLMLLCESDITSKNREKVKRFRDNFELVRTKLREIEEKDSIRNMKLPIRGEEIMETFGLPPSRPVGEILSAIKEAILDGKIPNEYEPARLFMLETAATMNLFPTKK